MGVPDIILGHSRETSLAAGKLNYVAFQEKIKQDQEEYEDIIMSQLGIDISFEDPVNIDITLGNSSGTNLRTTQSSNNKGANN